jgi:hypothetical protein
VDRGAVYSEPTGGLGFKDALLYGLYYLGAQIYGVGFQLLMMLDDPTSLQAAVGKGIPDREYSTLPTASDLQLNLLASHLLPASTCWQRY